MMVTPPGPADKKKQNGHAIRHLLDLLALLAIVDV
jgi:hypothetical protein